jgi:GNAT superfamily N-acetyltransferase
MSIEIRALQELELPEADNIFRLAFGTFVGLPDPQLFGGDSDYVRTRWRADPGSTFAALRDRELLGSNFVCRWGSFGFFGPLSVRPELWNAGIAKQLLVATMERFESWRLPHTGLFTFAESPKHIGLYQRFGFYPRFLTPIMAKSVAAGAPLRATDQFSALPTDARAACLKDCAAITGSLLDGLDVGSEIRACKEAQRHVAAGQNRVMRGRHRSGHPGGWIAWFDAFGRKRAVQFSSSLALLRRGADNSSPV